MLKKINVVENENKKAYNTNKIIEKENMYGKKKNYYEESIDALIKYIKNSEKNPNEKKWNCYAVSKNYLSSKTIGYLSNIKFNALCKKIRKQINKNKRQIKK